MNLHLIDRQTSRYRLLHWNCRVTSRIRVKLVFKFFSLNYEFPSKLNAYTCLALTLAHNLVTFIRRPLSNIILKSFFVKTIRTSGFVMSPGPLLTELLLYLWLMLINKQMRVVNIVTCSNYYWLAARYDSHGCTFQTLWYVWMFSIERTVVSVHLTICSATAAVLLLPRWADDARLCTYRCGRGNLNVGTYAVFRTFNSNSIDFRLS